MKYSNKFKGLLIVLLIMCSTTILAQDFHINGIYYNITDATNRTVEVTYCNDEDYYSNKYRGAIVIPEFVTYNYRKFTVTSIGESSFSNCSELTSVTIPNSVFSIGKYAFENCSKLTSITIPNSVKSIEHLAFNGCDALDSVYISDLSAWCNIDFYSSKGVNGIIPGEFVYCRANPLYYANNLYLNGDLLTNVVIPNDITNIKDAAFYGYKSLKSVSIHNKVTSIGISAFMHCDKLMSVTIPNGVTTVGKHAFYGCKLETITIPSSVTHIGENAFSCNMSNIAVDKDNSIYDSREDCNAIIETMSNTLILGCKNAVIPNGVTSIGKYAFYYCSNFENLIIPSSVESIGDYAFNGCNNLKYIVVDSDNNVYDSREECNAIIESATNSILLACDNTIIPSDIKCIKRSAFTNCKTMTNIIIPNSIESIESYAFNGCTALKDIYFYSNPKFGDYSVIPSTTNSHLIIEDNLNKNFNIENENTYDGVCYIREINEGDYKTIILPFSPDAMSLADYIFYELAECGEGYMRFEEVLTPKANTPYIYSLREGREGMIITGLKTTISPKMISPTVNGCKFVGSFTNQVIDTSVGYYYALSATSKEINRITKKLTVLPYRAYFKSDDASKSALSIFISGTTGVKEISPSDIEGFGEDIIFDLNGRKVIEPTNGNIYIKNGKKIIL